MYQHRCQLILSQHKAKGCRGQQQAPHGQVHSHKVPHYLVLVPQDKVVASMPKQQDPQDPEVRQLPSEGLSSGAIRQRLNYKVSLVAQSVEVNMLCCECW